MRTRIARGLALALAAVTLAACSAEPAATEAAPEGGKAVEVGHIHGLGVNPADGALFVATHLGVYRVADGSAERVADRYQDTMAFTVVGPDHFLASGHPDLREDLPPHLGLIESRDGARTWRPLSLLGKADFHALDVAGTTVFGFDGLSRTVLRSTDGTRWQPAARIDVVDLAASPDGRVLLATTPRGELVASTDGGQTFRPRTGAPVLVLVDMAAGQTVAGVGPAGEVYASRDLGASWQRVGELPGPPVALDATARAWHAATESAVLASTDEGRSWQPVPLS